MPKEKRTGSSRGDSGSHCTHCWKQPDEDAITAQSRRHQHFLTFPYGKALEAHLLEQYGEDKDGSIRAITIWYYGQKEQVARKQPEMAQDGRDSENAPMVVWDDDIEI